MRIRGFLHERSGSGVRAAGEGEAWVMALQLQPWRLNDGPPSDGTALVWRLLANHALLKNEQTMLPAPGTLVEIAVDAPRAIPGLDFRARAPHEFVFVRLVGPVVDEELSVLARAIAPPATVHDAVLGDFAWSGLGECYQAERAHGGVTYTIFVVPKLRKTPEADLVAARGPVLAFEARLAEVTRTVAERMHPLWSSAWRDVDEGDPDLDLAEFAARLALESVHVDTEGRLTEAQFNDDQLFLGHSIAVSFDDAGDVTSTDLYG